MKDLIIIGAGPCGLSVAIESKKQGLNPLVIDKGCIVNSIYYYPTNMQFFSTPELLEIGGLPFVTTNEKPNRLEALKYYRAAVKAYNLDVHTYERVTGMEKEDGHFVIQTEKNGEIQRYTTRHVVMATGYYDNPNKLNIPGEERSKVKHYYTEGHPYAGLNVLVIGGKNSAVDCAMDLHQAGANVTMAYRRGAFTNSVKAWVKPVIESAIQKGWIKMYWNTVVKRILEDKVELEQEGHTFSIANDAVFAMTGYRPKTDMLQKLGVNIDSETGAPIHDSETMETQVPGLYIAGVIAAGKDANSIFIENGRYHGGKIAAHIGEKMRTATS
ncbi:YpdA family putative bacillithiol disulfide reductase [Melghirimyces algeriensis]|uniref:Thioredoxin reductase (NADPH) n=1 Tax=Melghirimyces algeriensis TaxID=910412 RepID=A0A521B4D0_9BACL|nr:YpdA family putative bacillithiol disulfide reductase [Melghirimyces algeriensis]SMO41958.1 thioredoxin reductase (NADPH) [Melghirimyces algeriensis]